MANNNSVIAIDLYRVAVSDAIHSGDGLHE
jgi:hypothetical protein